MIPLSEDEMLVLRGSTGTIGIVKTGSSDRLFLETEKEEVSMFFEPDDLIVASCFETGDRVVKALRCVLFMIREMKQPLIVLPKKHPATKRLRLVVSAGGKTRISCKITPGTHPEQDILCGSDEFDGLEIAGVPGGVEFRNLRETSIDRMRFDHQD